MQRVQRQLLQPKWAAMTTATMRTSLASGQNYHHCRAHYLQQQQTQLTEMSRTHLSTEAQHFQKTDAKQASAAALIRSLS